MGKRIKKGKRAFIVVESLLIILTLSFIFGIYHLHNKIELRKKEFNILEKNYNKKIKELGHLKRELSKLNKVISDYNDIDNAIVEKRNEYFTEIKKVEDDILAGKSERKIAYITFDDGPYYNTHRVLDILDENDVKATFFTISMNGEYCYDNKDENCFSMYKEYLKRGHTIANHTYSHAIFKGLYNSTDSFMNSLIMQEEHIKNMTGGYITNIVRFPGGSSTAKGLKDSIIGCLKERGYGWVDWTAYDGDGGGLYSTDQAWDNLKRTLNDKIEVILFHDYNRITTEILPDVISYLKDNGYEIYPLFYESNMINK